MNRLPDKKKPGDPVLAADWNALLDAIAARTPKPGAGLRFVSSSGGFAYSAPGGALVPRQSLPPFAVIGIEKSGTDYDVVIREGWVIERKPKAGDSPAVKFHMPKFGDDPLNEIPRPRIPMSIGDTLWCKYQTGTQGEVTGTPEMIVEAEDQDGAHYQPEDPDGSGVDGDYCVQILKLEDDGGTPQVKAYQQSDIEHWAQLWTGRNLGSGARVYKEHDEGENIFWFRSVRGDYGISELETAGEVELNFDAATLGDGREVYLPEGHEDKQDDEVAEFRSIDGGESGRDEIQVYRKSAGVIGIRGNGVDGAIQLDEDGNVTSLIEAVDGLVKLITATTIFVREYKVCVDGSPVTKKFLTLD